MDVLTLPAKVQAGGTLEDLQGANPPSVVVGPSGQRYEGTSFWTLRPYHEPRRTAIRMIEVREMIWMV